MDAVHIAFPTMENRPSANGFVLLLQETSPADWLGGMQIIPKRLLATETYERPLDAIRTVERHKVEPAGNVVYFPDSQLILPSTSTDSSAEHLGSEGI